MDCALFCFRAESKTSKQTRNAKTQNQIKGSAELQ